MVKTRNIRVQGLDALIDAYRQAGASAPEFAHKALFEEAQEAFNLSQMVVPVEFGVLRSSGDVSSQRQGTKSTAEIRYGGGGADYAVYVHEIPPSRARHAPPTRWKYLEFPVKEYSKGMAERMRVRVLDMINRRFNI